MDTLYVVLYGGPGTGKSTTAAAVFASLKQQGYNVEIAHEYAKDLTWEKRSAALGYQPYVAAKQMWREKRLDGQVQAVITDTSPLLGLVYGAGQNTPAFEAFLRDEEQRKNNINFFLRRDPNRAYNPAGRNQTQAEAEALDEAIEAMLRRFPAYPVRVDKITNLHVDQIVAQVKAAL